MRTRCLVLGEGIATEFGIASGPCVCPPETDYRTIDLAIVQTFDGKDSILTWREDQALVALSAEGFAPATHSFEWSNDWNTYTADFDLTERQRIHLAPGEWGACIRWVTITDNAPLHHSAGIYERIH